MPSEYVIRDVLVRVDPDQLDRALRRFRAAAAASSFGSRPWCVPNARSERPRASGEYAGIISIPSRAMARPNTLHSGMWIGVASPAGR